MKFHKKKETFSPIFPEQAGGSLGFSYLESTPSPAHPLTTTFLSVFLVGLRVQVSPYLIYPYGTLIGQ